MTCSRANSDQYSAASESQADRLSDKREQQKIFTKEVWAFTLRSRYDKSDRRSDQTSLPPGKPISYAIKIPVLVRSEKLQLINVEIRLSAHWQALPPAALWCVPVISFSHQ